MYTEPSPGVAERGTDFIELPAVLVTLWKLQGTLVSPMSAFRECKRSWKIMGEKRDLPGCTLAATLQPGSLVPTCLEPGKKSLPLWPPT